ncbi:MAG: hypothetical protein HY952_06255 [Elusimicrobia bacterium]|nr:hypothetical protein [Elusimicrobiota bacterium]
MPFLPRLRCPACGRTIHGIDAKVVPPAEKYEDCLRRCTRCHIGASNAKNPAKVRFIQGPKPAAPAEPPPAEQPPPVPQPGSAEPTQGS